MPQSITDALPYPPTPGQIPQVPASASQPPGVPAGPQTSNDNFSSLIEQAKKDSDTLKKKGEQESAVIEANQKKIDDLKVPQPPELTPAPKPKESNPLEGFGSAAGWIAVFGSMLTRAPLTSALNASAAAMNAAQQKNAAEFQQKMDEWKANTENALKLHQFELDAYKDDLEKLKAGDTSALTDIQVTAASFKNDTIQLLASKAQSDAVIKQIDAQAKMQTSMAKNADKAQLLGDYIEWTLSPEGQKATPEQKARKYLEMTNPTVATAEIKGEEKKEENAEKNKPTWDDKEIATAGQAILDGVRPNVAVPGYGAKNPNRDAAMKWATEHAPVGWDMANAQLDYLGRTQEERSESTIASKTKFATNSLDNSLPLLENAIKKVDLSRFTDINSIENYYRSHTSDENYRHLVTALQTTIIDYSALIARNGQSTDSTRAQAREILNETMGAGGMEAVVDQMRKEAQAQLSAASKTTGRDEGGLKTYSPADYKKAIADKTLKSGDHFLTSDGVEHTVQ